MAAPVVAIGLVLILARMPAAGLVVTAIGVAVGAFFRDPERKPPAQAMRGAVISGADGRVSGIDDAPLPNSSSERLYKRISVFMSPLDVHVNRAPISGEVVDVRHTKGEFRAAFRDSASEHNERNLIRIEDETRNECVMVQVAGYFARRIICRVRPHQRLERGQRVGLIMFGSRVDHFLPREYRVAVKPGDRVRAGETIIGEPQS
ncbi:MAG TPA: phosphatidylserine decarboxylase [Candidatus Binataceae bacterium]|nr:phosphatidylserine decarboxylase [Candidatus Binataceae bacterium]